MKLAPEIHAVLPAIAQGLNVAIAGSAPVALKPDLATLQFEPGALSVKARGRAEGGASISATLRVREGLPAVEVDAILSNGEVSKPGLLAPHIPAVTLGFDLSALPGWVVEHRVQRGIWPTNPTDTLYQGGLAVFQLVLVPKSFAEHPAFDTMIADPPWLAKAEPTSLDGLDLPQASAVPKAVLDQARNDATLKLMQGLTSPDYSWLKVDTGGATSGDGIRTDHGLEFAYALTPGEQYRLMWGLVHRILARPQRGFLTHDGLPMGPEHPACDPKLNVTVGPTESLFPNAQGNPYGFDMAPLPATAFGSIDLQHFIRAIGPVLFLAQRFRDPLAIELIGWYAAAARLDAKPSEVLQRGKTGQLGRADAWCCEIQVADAVLNGSEGAKAWIAAFVEAVETAQTPHGGICAWTHNKEAIDYARMYVYAQLPTEEKLALDAQLALANPGAAVAVGSGYKLLPVEPVTQPYQETLLLRAMWLVYHHDFAPTKWLGRMASLAHFITTTARDPSKGAPWYRTLTDGTNRALEGTDGYLWGEAIAIANWILNGTQEWFYWAKAAAGTPPATLLGWRNRWHLEASKP